MKRLFIPFLALAFLVVTGPANARGTYPEGRTGQEKAQKAQPGKMVGAKGRVEPSTQVTTNFYAVETGLRGCREGARALYGSAVMGASVDLMNTLADRVDKCLGSVQDNIKNVSDMLPETQKQQAGVQQSISRLRDDTRAAMDIDQQLRKALTRKGYEQRQVAELSTNLYQRLNSALLTAGALGNQLSISALQEPPRRGLRGQERPGEQPSPGLRQPGTTEGQ